MVESERVGRRVRGVVIRAAALAAVVALSMVVPAQDAQCTRLRPAFAVPAHGVDVRVEIARTVVLDPGGEPEVIFSGRLPSGRLEYAVRILTFQPGGRLGDRVLFTVPPGGPRYWLYGLFAGDFDGDGAIDILVAWGSSQGSQPRGFYELYRRAPSGEYLPAVPLATSYSARWRLAGDVDGDGRTELVLGTSSGIEVHQFDTAGGWTLAGGNTMKVEYPPAIGDFDGDGADDLAVARYDRPWRITLAWGAATSPLAFRSILAVPGLTTPFSPRAFQLDGAGRSEILLRGRSAAQRDQLHAVSVLSRERAVLLWSQSFDTSMPSDWRVLDLDGDRRDDAVFGPQLNSYDPPGFLTYHNDGTGPFRPGQVGTMAPSLIAVRDLDGDGTPDGILFQYATFLWYHGEGDGVFDEGVHYALTDSRDRPRVADFDEDGTLDSATTDVRDGERGVRIGLGNGDGTFRDGEWMPREGFVFEFVQHDIDSDGHVDLLLISEGGAVQVAYGRGDGSFETWRSYWAPPERAEMVFGDLDGDGSDDLVLLGEALYGRSTRAYTSRITPILVQGREWAPASSITVPGGGAAQPLPRLALGEIADEAGEELVYVRREVTGSSTIAWRPFRAEENRFGPETEVVHWDGSQDVSELAVEDFDRDGRDDLLVRGGPGGVHTIRTYKGDGHSGLQLIRRQVSFGATYAGGQVAEVDGDGEWDLGGAISGALGWARGDGAGGFEVDDDAWYAPAWDAIFADLDNDGRPDRLGIPSRPFHPPFLLVFNRNLGTFAAADLTAPALDLRLLPAVDDEQTPARFDDGWRVQAIATDDCDAWPRTELRRVDAPLLEPETPLFYRSGETVEIRLWKDPGGSAEEVMLTGPEEGAVRDLWARVLAAGGFDLEPDQIVRMPLSEIYGAGPAAWGDDAFIPHSHRLVRRYVLEGERLVTAAVSEPGGDLVVQVGVADRAGHQASASVSLLEQKRRYCDEAQAVDVVCR